MKNLVLSAGAGTGKTTALVELALDLYAGKDGPPLEPAQVWAVTFTEKAAGELQSRLLTRARALAQGDSTGRWEAVARALPTAPVGTFHGLCAQLIRTHAAEAGLDPGFSVLLEGPATEAFERAREEVLLAELQDAAGPARRLVRELGGLDRLRFSLSSLSARLAEEGLSAGDLVDAPSGRPLPPFDPDAAPPRLRSFCAALHLALQEVARSSHERLAAPRQMLERERERLGTCEAESLSRWYPAAAAVMGASVGRGSLPREARPVWEAAKIAWEGVQDAFAAGVQARVGRDFAGLLERVIAAYRAEKRRQGSLDFADLIRGARDLLASHRDVRQAVKARVGALLVDEFQDTNGVQLDVVHLLGEERSLERELPLGVRAATLPLQPGVLRAVGDRKQSIYEFRGADVALFSELTDRARTAGDFELRALRTSWRSLPGIVRFVNEAVSSVLAQGTGRPFEVGWDPSLDVLSAGRPEPAGTGYPAVELLDSDPTLPTDERRRFESALVARHVARLLRSGRPVEREGRQQPIRGRDVALLLRTFSEVEVYRRALAERGVPSVVVRGRGFFGTREVRDLAALLLALADPADRFAAAAVLRSPFVDLSDDALVALAAAGALSLRGLASPPALPGEDARKLARCAGLLLRLSREINRLGPAQVLSLAMDELDYLTVLGASFEGEQRVANVRKLLEWLSVRRGAGALALAQELLARGEAREDREPPADASGGDDAAVHVLTIHAAKGLEYPVVVLPELGAGERGEDGALLFDRELGLAIRVPDPVDGRLLDAHGERVKEQLTARRDAESSRLLYVAVTRARDLLVLAGNGRLRASFRNKLEAALEGKSGLVVRIPPEEAEEPLPPARPPGEESTWPAWATEAPAPVPVPIPVAMAPIPVRPARRRRQAEGQLDLFVQAQAAPVLPATLPGQVAPTVPALLPLALPPGRFVSAVTELEELARCQRRFFYKAVAGLSEHPAAGDAQGDDEDLDRLEKGQLAHRLLERVDVAALARDPASAVAEALAADAERQAAGASEIAADVQRALSGPLGTALGQAARVYRELPFVLEVKGPDGSLLALRGQIDLLLVSGSGEVQVIDHKHATARGKPADAYRFQLATYALAASRIFPVEVPVQAGIAWLKDAGALRLLPLPGAALAQHQAHLGELAATLTRIRDGGLHHKLAGPEACGDCGFAPRCWGGVGPGE